MRRVIGILLGALLLGQAWAGSPARIAIIIDDIGNDPVNGLRAADLPGAVTCAFLPFTPHAYELARRAHANGKEVMLHLPMQSEEGNPLGPGALTLDMTRQAMDATLRRALAAVPYAVGVNNHMGSLLTRHPGAMAWLMAGLKRAGGLYFIDSRTTDQTVAEQMANEAGLRSGRRHVFLDNEPDRDYIRGQLRELIARARRDGTAIAIGHPYPQTMAVLAEQLPGLPSLGVQLIPVSQLLNQQRSIRLWHASSSPSPKVAKNLKPSPSSTCCAEPASTSSAPASTPSR